MYNYTSTHLRAATSPGSFICCPQLTIGSKRKSPNQRNTPVLNLLPISIPLCLQVHKEREYAGSAASDTLVFRIVVRQACMYVCYKHVARSSDRLCMTRASHDSKHTVFLFCCRRGAIASLGGISQQFDINLATSILICHVRKIFPRSWLRA